MTFITRAIELSFTLGHDASGNAASFNASGANVVTLTGHRVQVSVSETTGPGMGEARIRVYGLVPSILNRLSSLNSATATAAPNRVVVKAGDNGHALAIVFDGQINLAQADMSQQPTTTLNIMAFGGLLNAVQPIPPSSYPGAADAAIILQNLASQMGLAFENSGASKMLATPYFWGDAKKQAMDCARAAGFEIVIDRNTLAIWPKGQARGLAVPLISPDTGMVGYPTYSSMSDGGGITVKTLFNPQIRAGGAVQVKSALPVANGRWLVFHVGHELEAEVPGGQWFTHFTGSSLAPT
ncbi:MAG: hypothetical protein KGL43_02780 [Burkholderiales bacterium]|nr:hypothetical protein [Burkholderiales bacterium]MDE2395464.1 hypothetical protein [Burkholderiales bacterium]MDE2452495.1 hypothetical protein [Burkholderiales bacterium]